MVRFFLGTASPHWLRLTDVPLFVSAVRLRRSCKRGGYRALGEWALDSGGFSELSLHGRWTVSARQYADEARRWRDRLGNLAWAAQQDWMCEPFITAKTGGTVRDHQLRTVDNFLELTRLAPDLPWVPVLQGYAPDDYRAHLSQWLDAGVDLAARPLVGLGSVCRRQHTGAVERLIRDLARRGLRLHGFGFKVKGLERVADALASADSMAWSRHARSRPPLPGCPHPRCTDCLRYALRWRERLIDRVARPDFGPLFF